MKWDVNKEYYSIHDHDIRSYTVDIKHKSISMQTEYCGKEIAEIRFDGLLGHKFDYVLDSQNIILCINEISIASFIQEENDFLEESWKYGFLAGKHEFELQIYLEQNGYRVYYIESAIGLSGFVIAKDISITITPVIS